MLTLAYGSITSWPELAFSLQILLAQPFLLIALTGKWLPGQLTQLQLSQSVCHLFQKMDGMAALFVTRTAQSLQLNVSLAVLDKKMLSISS